MYGLTDNIVAGPAGHVEAAAAGHFEAGPSGSFTAAPAGHTPVSEAGYVPIDCTPALIPYRAQAGGMIYSENNTSAPIPGPAAHVPTSMNTGGGGVSLGGAILGGLGGGLSVNTSGGSSGIGIGGGSVSTNTGGGALSVNTSGGSSGIGVGGGAISANTSGGSSGSGIGGGPVSANTSGGINYVAYMGAGFPPMELRVGQALSTPSASPNTTPNTEGFTVTPGGRTTPTPTGYIHPPPASRFHGSPQTHVAHHPVFVRNSVVTTEAYQGYHAAYVWQGRPEGSPPPPFLAGDYVKPSSYEPAHVIFPDEKPGPKPVVNDSIGGSHMEVSQTVNQTVNQDYGQSRSVEYSSTNVSEKSVAFDNSVNRDVAVDMSQKRDESVSIDMSRSSSVDMSTQERHEAQVNVEDAARVLNMFFLNDAATIPAALSMGGPLMARVA